jgi:hypothetical protein
MIRRGTPPTSPSWTCSHRSCARGGGTLWKCAAAMASDARNDASVAISAAISSSAGHLYEPPEQVRDLGPVMVFCTFVLESWSLACALEAENSVRMHIPSLRTFFLESRSLACALEAENFHFWKK